MLSCFVYNHMNRHVDLSLFGLLLIAALLTKHKSSGLENKNASPASDTAEQIKKQIESILKQYEHILWPSILGSSYEDRDKRSFWNNGQAETTPALSTSFSPDFQYTTEYDDNLDEMVPTEQCLQIPHRAKTWQTGNPRRSNGCKRIEDELSDRFDSREQILGTDWDIDEGGYGNTFDSVDNAIRSQPKRVYNGFSQDIVLTDPYTELGYPVKQASFQADSDPEKPFVQLDHIDTPNDDAEKGYLNDANKPYEAHAVGKKVTPEDKRYAQRRGIFKSDYNNGEVWIPYMSGSNRITVVKSPAAASGKRIVPVISRTGGKPFNTMYGMYPWQESDYFSPPAYYPANERMLLPIKPNIGRNIYLFVPPGTQCKSVLKGVLQKPNSGEKFQSSDQDETSKMIGTTLRKVGKYLATRNYSQIRPFSKKMIHNYFGLLDQLSTNDR